MLAKLDPEDRIALLIYDNDTYELYQSNSILEELMSDIRYTTACCKRTTNKYVYNRLCLSHKGIAVENSSLSNMQQQGARIVQGEGGKEQARKASGRLQVHHGALQVRAALLRGGPHSSSSSLLALFANEVLPLHFRRIFGLLHSAAARSVSRSSDASDELVLRLRKVQRNGRCFVLRPFPVRAV